MDGAGLVLADGEDGAADHLLELALGHGDTLFGVHVRQIWVVLGVRGRDGEGGDAAADGYLIIVVHGDLDHIVRQLPDDIEEEAGREDIGAGLLNLGGYGDGDAGLQIVARQHQGRPRRGCGCPRGPGWRSWWIRCGTRRTHPATSSAFSQRNFIS